ncbi:MAG TPA: hypothetical protein VNZ03_17585 [Terriglobales bacterium]|nr:hypothetical protein [Terriglobales bacterium]
MTFALKSRTWRVILLCVASLICLCRMATAVDTIASSVTLDRGFSLLYNLDFGRAHQVFLSFQQEHPDNPMGPVCDAAGFLFSEFNRLGVLEAQFYADDQAFAARKKLTPDGGIRDRFYAALNEADSRAHSRLTKNPKDRDALLALTMSSGLKADYAGLIDKHNLASLHYTKEATAWAEQLLAEDPECYDAHLATGVSQYIIGSMAAPIRWLVRLGGVSGDKQKGIADLQLTAQHGHYLAPFARILLAIAYVREKDKPRARELLVSLRNEFPQNPLFTQEIAHLDTQPLSGNRP